MSGVKIDRVIQFSIAVCLAVIVWVISDTFTEKVIAAGDTAPKFSVTTDAGRAVSRDDFGGKLLVLNFWASWCPPCIEEMPSLNEFQKTFAGSGVVVLGVSVDQSASHYEALLKKARPSFLTARDPEAKISSDYGTFRYPETYIIDTNGKVREKMIGPRNWTDPDIVGRVKSLLSS